MLALIDKIIVLPRPVKCDATQNIKSGQAILTIH